MFVTLPLFLCLGFVSGYALKRESAAWPQAGGLRRTAGIVALLVLIVGAGILLSLYRANVTEYRLMIVFGSFAVGAAAGLWFVAAKQENSRDVLISIFGAGLMVALAALEYDVKIFENVFGRVSKFSAAGVSLELDSSHVSAPEETVHRNQVDVVDDNRARWPGGDRLDYIIGSLFLLGDRELRDEQFARMFAHAIPADATDVTDPRLPSQAPAMSPLAFKFVRYGCERLAAIAQEMGATQNRLRDEAVASPDVETLVNHLRIFYFRAIGSQATDSGDIEADLSQLESRLKLENQMENVPEASPKPKVSLCSFPQAQATPGRPLDAAHIQPDDFQVYGYIALCLALLEAATGDREGAVQLLDREIVRQQHDLLQSDLTLAEKPCPAGANDACAAENVAVLAKRLGAFRRLVLVARLEDSEDGLMDSMRNTEISLARVHSLTRLIHDFSAAFVLVRTQDSYGLEIFRIKPNEDGDKRCLTSSSYDTAEIKLLARWSLVRAVGISNALENAALVPELLHEDKAMTAQLDSYAEYLAALDVGCVKRQIPKLGSDVPRHFVKITARYWETRALLLSSEGEDRNDNDVLDALCKARTGYRKVVKMFENEEPAKMAETDFSSELDYMQAEYHDEMDKHETGEAARRIDQQLKDGFPLGDVEKRCPN